MSVRVSFHTSFWEDQFMCLPLDLGKQMLCGVQDMEALLLAVSSNVASITVMAPGRRNTGCYQTLPFNSVGSAGP